MNRRNFFKAGAGLALLPLLTAANAKGKAASGRTFVVLVGVETYRNDKLVSPVAFAVNDAKNVAEAFTRKFQFRQVKEFSASSTAPSGQILLLTSDDEDKPTAQRVLDVFTDLASSLKAEDSIIVLWAAHGTELIYEGKTQQWLWTWTRTPNPTRRSAKRRWRSTNCRTF